MFYIVAKGTSSPSVLVSVENSDPNSCLFNVELIKSSVAAGPSSSNGAIFFPFQILD